MSGDVFAVDGYDDVVEVAFCRLMFGRICWITIAFHLLALGGGDSRNTVGLRLV